MINYNNYQWAVTTNPSLEPISTDDVKLYARIDGTSEDTLIDQFIKAVREATENYLGRSLIRQTLTLSLNEFVHDDQSEVIELPRPPLISITEVRTVAEDGTTTTYSSDNYFVRTLTEPGQLVIKFGSTPPINTERYHGGYEVEFVAGYGSVSTDVPEAIRQGMIVWVSDIYENRVPISSPPDVAKIIMEPYRFIRI